MALIDSDDDHFELDDDVGTSSSGEPPLVYDGESQTIEGLPTRADLVRQSDTTGLTETLEAHLREGKTILFMPNDVNEENEYAGGNPVYKLHLFGPLANGAKAHVILDNIDVFFDVRVPDKVSKQDFGGRLRQILLEDNIMADRVEDHLAFPILGYRTSKVPWKRLYFPNVQTRKKAIARIRGLNYETANDDLANYFRMAARTYGVVLTDWGMLTDYEYYRGGAHPSGASTSRGAPASPLCEHVFRIDVRNFKPLIDPMSSKELQEKRSSAKRSNPNLSRDRTLVMTWDIETYSSARLGEVPMATKSTDNVFMICSTFHWKDDPSSLHKVCIVDVATEPDERWTTIECGTEENIIKAFAAVYRHFAPDIITGFNDGDYDWPFVIEKARQYLALSFMADTMSAWPRRRTTEEGVLRFNVNEKRIKISSEEMAFVSFMKVPGCIPIDVRVMFKKLFPKAEVGKGSSLNFYLNACNLSSKADMPYKRMWDIYVEATQRARAPRSASAEMRHVAHYCIIDAKRCQELLVKRNVINDRREVANLSYVSLNDAVYYADGHKVCNMLNAYALTRGILCSNISREKEESGKYPGAWVFHPEKGLVPDPSLDETVILESARTEYLRLKKLAETDSTVAARLAAAESAVLAALEKYCPGRPVTGLDFSSLYPSIIMAYNLSPEKFVATEAEAKRLEAEGCNLHYTEFQYNGRKVYGWFVRHNGVEADYGLYPSILLDLFGKRALMKVKLGVQEELKEHMELVMGLVKKADQGSSDKTEVFRTVFAAELETQRAKRAELQEEVAAAQAEKRKDTWRLENEAKAVGRNVDYMEEVAAHPFEEWSNAFQQAYRDTCFEFNSIDSKQKALKVFMNTFYGEAGNAISPFFLLQLAGGVTSAGQYNIKMVADFVTEKKFKIKYGDTDSLYLAAPENVFVDVDKRYALGELTKEEYWTEMVEITMAELDKLRDDVNACLTADNGTKHLKMAYEEVLFPVVFTGKKKYFGIAHVNVPNFHPKKLFIRGIDVVKQGQTELAKKIGYRIMWAAVALANAKDLMSIVEEVLSDAVQNDKQWLFEDFIQSDAWKPAKQNPSVQRFIARMKIRVAEEKAENERRVSNGLTPNKTLYSIPDPGERFRYILSKPGAAFDLRGRKTTPKKGDIMEYADVAQALNIPIDVGQYLKSYVVGLCARFINYAERFQPPPLQRIQMNEKALDIKSQQAAKSYLEVFLGTLQNADPETMRKRGYAYKRAWRNAAQECGDKLHSSIGPSAEVLHGEYLMWSDFLPSEEEPAAALAAQAKIASDELFDAEEYVAQFCEKLGIAPDGSDLSGPPPGSAETSTANRLYECTQLFETSARTRRGRHRLRQMVLSALDRREAAVRKELEALTPNVANTANQYEAHLARAVEAWRAREHSERAELGEFRAEISSEREDASFTLDGEALAALRRVRDIWYELVGIYSTRARHQAIVGHLSVLKDRRQKRAGKPARAISQRAIAARASSLPPMGLTPVGFGGY